MSVASKQPEIRFNKAGPYGMEGISFAPKILTLKKTISTATENEDFITLPAGTFINEAIGLVLDACDADTHVSLGTDGSAEAIFTTTAFDVSTVGNSCHFTTGLYLAAADTLRLAITGTPVAGVVEVVLSYFEVAAMVERGLHFEL